MASHALADLLRSHGISCFPFQPASQSLPSKSLVLAILQNTSSLPSYPKKLRNRWVNHADSREAIRRRRTSTTCNGTPAKAEESVNDAAAPPTPYINVDQNKPDVTVVELKFGDRLGALLDTMKALRALGLNVVRAKVNTVEAVGWNKFEITKLDGGKVTDPELVEAIRLTVIENLLQYHPESSTKLAMGLPSPQALQIPTSIQVRPIDAATSCIHVETPDRPGLLLEIVKVLNDISVQITSADIHTEGLVAVDDFVVSYRGEALNKSMTELVTNALQFYLTRYSLEEDSY